MNEENQIMNDSNIENPIKVPNLEDLVNQDSNNQDLVDQDPNNQNLNNQNDIIPDNFAEENQSQEDNKPKKTSKVKKVIFIILWVLWGLFLIGLAIIFLFIRWISNISEKLYESASTSNIKLDQVDGIYEFKWWYSRVNGVANYGLALLDDEMKKITHTIWDDDVTLTWEQNVSENDISLSTADYDWIDGLYDFSANIYLDLKFSEWKIIDWDIVDGKSKKKLWHLSIEELNEMYSFEAKYPIKEMKVKQWINLSELDENVIYKYVLTPEDSVSPWIKNDLDYDVIVYEKKDYGMSAFRGSEYEPKVYFSNESDFWWFRGSTSDETVYMIYQKATIEDILYIVKPLYLGQYERWEEIDIRSEDYLYNDTDETLRLVLIEESFWERTETEKKLLKPWEIYKKGSFVDYVVIR